MRTENNCNLRIMFNILNTWDETITKETILLGSRQHHESIPKLKKNIQRKSQTQIEILMEEKYLLILFLFFPKHYSGSLNTYKNQKQALYSTSTKLSKIPQMLLPIPLPPVQQSPCTPSLARKMIFLLASFTG